MKNRFVISFPHRTVILAKLNKVALVFPFFNKGFQLLPIVFVVKERISSVPFVNYPFPRCPTTDAKGSGEEIIIGNPLCFFIVIHARNHADALIMCISVKQFFAKREEREGRHVVIFQDNALVFMAECPLLGEIFGRVAAPVHLLVVAMYLTLPVNLFIIEQLSARFHAWQVAVVAWSILIQIQLAGASQFDLFKQVAQFLGTVKEEYQYRHVCFCRLFHVLSMFVGFVIVYFNAACMRLQLA